MTKKKKTLDLDVAAINDAQIHMLNTGCNFAETAREGLSVLGGLGPLSFIQWRSRDRDGFIIETRQHIIAYSHNGIGYAPIKYYTRSLFMTQVTMLDGVAYDSE